VTHPNGRSNGSVQNGGAAVNGELSLTIEDNEHLFGRVMEVVSDTSARHDLTAVHEIEIDVHCDRGNEQHASHVPGTFMRAAVLVLAGVRVTDSCCELGLSRGGRDQKSGKSKQS
jgi:hypothetical protein